MSGAERSGWPRWMLAGVASGILMLSFLIPLGRAFRSRLSEQSQLGAASMGVSIQRSGSTAADDVMLPGDRARFTYSTEREVQFALFHLGGTRADVRSADPQKTVAVSVGQDVPLDFTLVHDGRAGTDYVFALFCEAPVQLEPIRAALQKAGDFPHVPGCRSDSVSLRKKLL